MKLISLVLAGLVALTSLFSNTAPVKAQESTTIFLPSIMREPPLITSGGTGIYLEGSGPAPRIPAWAIVEWWGGNAQASCGIAIVVEGTFYWPYSGHWWSFNSQAELDAVAAQHVANFLAKPQNAECVASWPIAQTP